MGVGGQRHAPVAFTPGKDPVPIVQEAGWAPGPVWIGVENHAPTGIRSKDLLARSELLYRLRYPGPPSHRHCRNYLHGVCSSEHLTKLWVKFQCLQKTPHALFFH
jgi:hypothetical protein